MEAHDIPYHDQRAESELAGGSTSNANGSVVLLRLDVCDDGGMKQSQGVKTLLGGVDGEYIYKIGTAALLVFLCYES